jgi:predicted house-cleaning NTP pyrophosphatase (Maf/HAM1 superfamily)
VQPVDVDETARAARRPSAYVRRLAVLKAETLWQKLAALQRPAVLGADTAWCWIADSRQAAR